MKCNTCIKSNSSKKQIYPVQNIERYSNSVVVMDESAVSCDLDISNRAFLVYDSIKDGLIGEFDAELIEEFFRAVAKTIPISSTL